MLYSDIIYVVYQNLAGKGGILSVGTMGKLLTTEQVAEKLGKPVSWVYNNLLKEGIPFIKLGNQYRFIESQLDSWILSKLEGV